MNADPDTTRRLRLDVKANAMKRATYASVAVAVLLICLKVSAYLTTQSVALLSSLVDSILDALASIVNMLAVRHALSPADREHRFGHGKAEAIAGLAQGAFIAGSAVLLTLEAVQRLMSPVALKHTHVGIAVMLLSMVLTVALVSYQRYVARKTDSLAIHADSIHYLSDLLSNAGVIAALVLVDMKGWLLADPLIAMAIVVVIVRSAWSIIRQSLDQLMDRELPDDARQQIRELVMATPGVLEMHDLRTRVAGPTRFIQLHLEMPGDISLQEAHDIALQAEQALERVYPDAEIIIHQDPDDAAA